MPGLAAVPTVIIGETKQNAISSNKDNRVKTMLRTKYCILKLVIMCYLHFRKTSAELVLASPSDIGSHITHCGWCKVQTSLLLDKLRLGTRLSK